MRRPTPQRPGGDTTERHCSLAYRARCATWRMLRAVGRVLSTARVRLGVPVSREPYAPHRRSGIPVCLRISDIS